MLCGLMGKGGGAGKGERGRVGKRRSYLVLCGLMGKGGGAGKGERGRVGKRRSYLVLCGLMGKGGAQARGKGGGWARGGATWCCVDRWVGVGETGGWQGGSGGRRGAKGRRAGERGHPGRGGEGWGWRGGAGRRSYLVLCGLMGTVSKVRGGGGQTGGDRRGF